MSLFYWMSQFSHEAILIEVFLIGILATSYFGYLLLKKRRYGAAKNQIPDTVVRAFLMELLANAEGFKQQLFGENFTLDPKLLQGLKTTVAAMPAMPASGSQIDNELVKNLQTQLQASNVKADELAKLIQQLTSDKTALENKLKTAGTAAPAPAAGGGNDAELKEKIGRLEAKLSEYEVIEDDLANLKRYQQENTDLKAQLEKLGGKPVVAPVAAATAPAPAASAPEPAPAAAAPPTPEPAAEAAPAPAPTTPELEKVADKVEEAIAKPETAAPAPTPEPAPAPIAEAAPAPTPEPAAPAPAPAAAEAAPPAAEAPAAAPPAADNKSDSDLLNEFEKMLNS